MAIKLSDTATLGVSRAANTEESYKTKQIIVFKLGSEEYGLPIDQIKEVVLTPSITKVPLTSDYIIGVANIRGNILAVVDLEDRFDLLSPIGSNIETKYNYTLVIESEELKVGILVREVPNTLAIAEKDIDLSPGLLSDGNNDRNYIKGIVKLPQRLIILVDIFKIFAKDEVTVLV